MLPTLSSYVASANRTGGSEYRAILAATRSRSPHSSISFEVSPGPRQVMLASSTPTHTMPPSRRFAIAIAARVTFATKALSLGLPGPLTSNERLSLPSSSICSTSSPLITPQPYWECRLPAETPPNPSRLLSNEPCTRSIVGPIWAICGAQSCAMVPASRHVTHRRWHRAPRDDRGEAASRLTASDDNRSQSDQSCSRWTDRVSYRRHGSVAASRPATDTGAPARAMGGRA